MLTGCPDLEVETEETSGDFLQNPKSFPEIQILVVLAIISDNTGGMELRDASLRESLIETAVLADLGGSNNAGTGA